MAIAQNHVINIQPGVSAPLVIHCSQGDTGTVINLTVVNGDEEFDCSSYACSVHGTRSDRANWGPFTCNVSGSTVSFSLTSEMTAVAGSCLAEVSIGTVGTANFALLVENATFENGVTYSNDVSVYQNILAAVQTGITNETAERVAAVATEKNERVAAITNEKDERIAAVNAEATARRTADNTLQGNINSEASTRASADSNLQSQINQIVAPSGEAPSAAEVQNARIGADGVTYDTLGTAIRTQVNNLNNDKINAFVTYLEYTSTEDEHDITVSIPLQDGIKKYVEIQNIGTGDAWRYIGVYGNAPEGTQIVNQTVLLKANEKAKFEIPSNNFEEIVRVKINSNTKVRIFGELETAINNVIQKNNASKIVTYDKGYLKQNGGIYHTDGYNIVTAFNIKKDDTIYFTGGYASWCPLFGYYADGTAVPLLDGGFYTNKKISIKDEKIVMVKGFAANPNTANIVFGITENVTNENATTMQDCTYSNGNSTYISKTNDDSSAKFEVTGANGNMSFYNKKQKVLNGDYIFLKCEMTADKDCDIAVSVYSDPTDQRSLVVHLEKNTKSFITAKYNPCSKDGTLSIRFQYIGTPSENVKIEIQNFCVTINNMDCWYNEDTKLKLANYNTKDLYVSLDGKGHFGDINSAIMFAKNTFDVTKESVNIHIKNGVYNISSRNAESYPYAFVNKGANKINLIGEEVSHTIIKGYNSEKYQGKILDIGGDCYIKNLTVLSLNDGTYNNENDMSHNCYCIHNDSGIDSADNHTNTEKYQTLVENCNLYSECHSPVGAGLHNKQTQKYLNCHFTSNGIRSMGSLYVHASTESYATNMAVEIDGCTCISKDKTKAISLPNTSGYDALTYTHIPVSISRTIGVTNGTEITDVSKATHALQEDSALNNVEAWNY